MEQHIEQAIDQTVAEAPPLGPERRDQLAYVLSGGAMGSPPPLPNSR